MKRSTLIASFSVMSLLSTLAIAEEAKDPVSKSIDSSIQGTFEVTRSATIDHPLIVLPRQSHAGEADADGWLLSVKEEDGFRFYQATRGDRVHTARVALSSQRHIAFNPATSRFERLTPNVRVELRDLSALDQVVEAVGGTSGKAYPLLGFAIVHLPAGADPVRAAQSIRKLPVVVNAWLTVKGPRRTPR